MLVKYRGPFKTFNRFAHLIMRPVPDVPDVSLLRFVPGLAAVQGSTFKVSRQAAVQKFNVQRERSLRIFQPTIEL
jgi:hypothetical protein